MIKRLCIFCLSLFFLFCAQSAWAEDMVRIPSEGSGAVGYKGCEIEDVQTCSDAHVQKTSIAAFYLDAKPVTLAELRACVSSKKCTLDENSERAGATSSKEDAPAVVSYAIAEQYCKSVGKMLPTEEQWLAAALADGVKKYPWGEEMLTTATAVIQIDNFTSLEPVGSMPSDQVGGIYDLAGNGYEWVNAPLMEADYPPDAACIAWDSRVCMGGAPLPLYQKIGIRASGIATFRCAKSAD